MTTWSISGWAALRPIRAALRPSSHQQQMTWTRCHQKVLFSTLFCFRLVWFRSTTDGIKSNQVGSILGQSEPADIIMVAFDLFDRSSDPVVRVRFSFKQFYFRSSVPNTLLHPGPAKLNFFLLLLALSMRIPLHINSTSCLAFMFCFRKKPHRNRWITNLDFTFFLDYMWWDDGPTFLILFHNAQRTRFLDHSFSHIDQ